jgi:hypothetical protein
VNKQMGIIAGACAGAILLVGGVAIAVSGGGDDDKSVEASTDTTTTTLAQETPSGNSGGGSGGGSSQGGSGGGSQSQNKQPYFQPDHSIESEFDNGVPIGRVSLHAYDDDGPNDKEVYQVEFSWGDGEQDVIPGSQGSNNAFEGYHEYDSSYKGQTVHIIVKAIDDDGGVAQFEGDLTLPSQ